MQYRKDEKSGNKLSILGYGCMRFPRGVNAKIDPAKTEKLVMSAIERGVNYFDTAYLYGGSEAALGEVLAKNSARKKIYLATKLPHYKCKVYDDFEKIFQTQLERLKTDYIDYYLIHNVSAVDNWTRLTDLGIEKWIAEKKASGQVRQIGFSFHGPQNEFMALLDVYNWDFVQIQYNYMNENYQAGRAGMQKAHEKNMPVIIMEPLLGGRLAGNMPKRAAKLLSDADASLSPAAWALRWIWNQPEATVVLSGMGAEDQLADNIKTAETSSAGMLSDKHASMFAELVSIFNEAYKIPCTGCNYCMPCPHGVNIPGCFAAYNARHALGYITGMTQYITGTGLTDPNKNYSARKCQKCGLCEKKCPQHIEIIKSLETVSKKMEPAVVRGIMKVALKFMR